MPVIISLLRKIAAYSVPVLGAIAAGQFNPFPVKSPFHDAVVPVAAALGAWLSLRFHPNGVNGPAATPEPVTGIKPILMLALFAAAIPACRSVGVFASGVDGASFSASAGGQAVSGSVNADGTGFCFHAAPPIPINGKPCEQFCLSSTSASYCAPPPAIGTTTSALTLQAP